MHGWNCENDKPEEVMFKQYKRKGLSEMRPYVKGEDLSQGRTIRLEP